MLISVWLPNIHALLRCLSNQGGQMSDRYRKSEESFVYSGFYHIPSFNSLLISKDGVVLDLRTGEKHVPKVVASGYLMAKSLHVHRLLALAFLKVPEDYSAEMLDVNHIDGNKENCSLDNLEWATRQRNHQHAYDTGLRSDNTPVLVMDVRDGSIVRYNTLWECARAFNLNGAHIHNYVAPKNRGKIYQKHFVFVYEGEPWPIIDVEKNRVKYVREVALRPMEGIGDSYVFETVSDAAAFLGVTGGGLLYHLKGDKKLNGFKVDYLDELTSPLTSVVVFERVKSTKYGKGKRPPVPVKVTDLVTGTATDWNSVEAFAKSVGASKNTVQKSMLKKDGRWKTYQIEYVVVKR
jgi:hypothetical protein